MSDKALGFLNFYWRATLFSNAVLQFSARYILLESFVLEIHVYKMYHTQQEVRPCAPLGGLARRRKNKRSNSGHRVSRLIHCFHM